MRKYGVVFALNAFIVVYSVLAIFFDFRYMLNVGTQHAVSVSVEKFSVCLFFLNYVATHGSCVRWLVRGKWLCRLSTCRLSGRTSRASLLIVVQSYNILKWCWRFMEVWVENLGLMLFCSKKIVFLFTLSKKNK